MKLREWARATHRALRARPASDRPQRLSQAQVEDVLQVGVRTLIEHLAAGEALRLDDLGRLWVEDLPPQRVVSNLPGAPRTYTLAARRVVRFRPSTRLSRVPERAGPRRRATGSAIASRA